MGQLSVGYPSTQHWHYQERPMRKPPAGQLQASGSRQKPADNGSQSMRRSQPISRSAFVPNIDLPAAHQRIKQEPRWRTPDSDDASSAVDAQADRRRSEEHT